LGFSYQYLMISNGEASSRTVLPELPEDAAWHQADGWSAIVFRELVGLSQLERVATRLSRSSRLVAAVGSVASGRHAAC
jgi:hypothetical protein